MNLSERNRRIVLRLKDGETLAAIGASYGITRERVRQIAGKKGVRSVRWIDAVDMTHRDVDTILDRLDRGMPHAHIAELADCHPAPNPTKTVAGRVRIALAKTPALTETELARIARCTPRRAGIARWQLRNADHCRNMARQRHAERAAA